MMTTSNNETKIISLGAERRNLANKIALLDENKIKDLSKKIENSFEEVQKKYDELNDVASPIVEKKHLLGLIKTTNVEKSLEGLLNAIQGLAKCTLGAFQANGDNLEAILNLMKISVSIENDLYKQLEDSDCSKENIANLLHDLCEQYDIDSKAIEDLFEQSFNRTVTLRTRINDLRLEIFEHISIYEEKFEHLDETIQKKEEEITSCIDNKIIEYNKQLEAHITKFQTAINDYKNELNIVRNSYKQEIESVKSFLINSIKQYNIDVSKQYNTKFEQYEKNNKELKTHVNVLSQKIAKLQKRLIWGSIVSTIATIIAIISLII